MSELSREAEFKLPLEEVHDIGSRLLDELGELCDKHDGCSADALAALISYLSSMVLIYVDEHSLSVDKELEKTVDLLRESVFTKIMDENPNSRN